MRDRDRNDIDPRTVRGSFSLWWQERFKPFLEACADLLVERIGERNVRGIFLCGSFAADEGSVVLETTIPIILSDVDLVVVLESLESMRAFYKMRSELGNACEKLMPDVRFSGHIDIGMFLTESLRGLPPRPGVFEMKARGRMLYGDEKVLDLIPAFEPAAIGNREAVILIENRIISLLGAFPEKSGGSREDLYPFLYEVARVYTDLATAALCLTGLYRLGYRKRWELLQTAIEDQDSDLLRRLLPDELVAKIGRWTIFKLSPSIENHGIASEDGFMMQLWEECERDVLAFWRRGEAYVQDANVTLADPPPVSTLLATRKRSGRWIDHYRNWNWYLSVLPRIRRISLFFAIGKRLLSTEPIDIVREQGVRLIDRHINRDADGSIPKPPGGFPHRGSTWRDATASLVSVWRELVTGRKDS